MYVYWFYGKIIDVCVKIVIFFLGGGIFEYKIIILCDLRIYVI